MDELRATFWILSVGSDVVGTRRSQPIQPMLPVITPRFVNCRRLDVLTMYSTTWCGYCKRLKSQFDQEGIAYEVVDIEQDAAAAEYVMGINGGNQTVPTVRFADGSALTNPSITDVRSRLVRIAAGFPTTH